MFSQLTPVMQALAAQSATALRSRGSPVGHRSTAFAGAGAVCGRWSEHC